MTPLSENEDPVKSGPVVDLESLRSAVVQIRATGTFADIETGTQTNQPGAGTGFIIDPEGIAVTNNHVVTGAAFLEVYIDGEETPRSARVLGVSECSDIAVIDIEGDGFPYLRWYDDEIRVGLDVYAAGFPLGDPEFTLTRGIISKENADGDSSWASVEAVLEHDATINPGNSGGPLVTNSGQVVGVNYAASRGTNQYFAISRDVVLDIVETLRQGTDIDAIGVNAQALTATVNNGFGIWVASVEPGSPASQAGIEPEDIIINLQGFQLTEVPTMAEYCKILRSHTATETMSIEVLRIEDGQLKILEGQLNGAEMAVVVAVDLTDLQEGETVSEESAPAAGGQLAVAGYTSTDICVTEGDTVAISSTGSIIVGPTVGAVGPDGTVAGAFGLSLDAYDLIPAFAHGALLCTENPDAGWRSCGSYLSFEADYSGCLYFEINDNDQINNSGAFSVTVEVDR